jgi:hypothetical protein
MKKSWYDYEKIITREQLLIFGWFCSIPIIGWIALSLIMILKNKLPDTKHRWKRKVKIK